MMLYLCGGLAGFAPDSTLSPQLSKMFFIYPCTIVFYRGHVQELCPNSIPMVCPGPITITSVLFLPNFEKNFCFSTRNTFTVIYIMNKRTCLFSEFIDKVPTIRTEKGPLGKGQYLFCQENYSQAQSD